MPFQDAPSLFFSKEKARLKEVKNDESDLFHSNHTNQCTCDEFISFD